MFLEENILSQADHEQKLKRLLGQSYGQIQPMLEIFVRCAVGIRCSPFASAYLFRVL